MRQIPSPIRVVQFGLGPIGLESVRVINRKEKSGAFTLVGAIDVAPDKAGRDVYELAGLSGNGREPLLISADAEEVLASTRPDVVLHTTSSFLDMVADQLSLCLKADAHVVSTTEELFYPFERHPGLAARLDEEARAAGRVLTGTGVNPGFVMDLLPLLATGVCTSIHSVSITRVVDAGKRRMPLQRKVGAGLSEVEFAEKKAAGTFGHIGLVESMHFLAAGLGWQVNRYEESLTPVLAGEAVQTPFFSVQPGQVAGIHHTVTGFVAEEPLLSLDLRMYVGAGNSFDAVHVDGDPPLDLMVRGGVFGDTATVGMLVNAVPVVMQGEPGLRLASELYPVRAFGSNPRR